MRKLIWKKVKSAKKNLGGDYCRQKAANKHEKRLPLRCQNWRRAGLPDEKPGALLISQRDYRIDPGCPASRHVTRQGRNTSQ
jgi:hypothetical protein